MKRDAPCPCDSGQTYGHCCEPLHRGAPAPTPEALMRSRYSAYAAGVVEYLISTTDPDGPQFDSDRRRWTQQLFAYCRDTSFDGLDVLESSSDGDSGSVSFRARLSQGGRDLSFGERSAFVRVDGRWLYHSGDPID